MAVRCPASDFALIIWDRSPYAAMPECFHFADERG